MTPIQFLQSLQLTDSFFPVGAFAYSDGLETVVSLGAIRDADSLKIWLNHFLSSVFVPCDGLALLKCVQAFRRGDECAIHGIDEELTAIKPSAAVRNASRSVGRRLLTVYAEISRDERFTLYAKTLPQCNAPVAYAVVLAHRGLDSRDALLAFGYSRLAGIVSAGIRLISMGQQQAQNLLSELLETLPGLVDQIIEMETEPLRSFAPLMDIAQMNHRYVYSRLFRS